jgi:hypothetical protein
MLKATRQYHCTLGGNIESKCNDRPIIILIDIIAFQKDAEDKEVLREIAFHIF